MTVAVQTLIDRSVRNMGAVDPHIKERAIELIHRAYTEGIYVEISSGFRSFDEQAKLYGQGRASYLYNGKQYAQPGKPVVTNAKPGQSIHNYGLAIDFFLVSADGATGMWEVTNEWRRAAAIGKGLGFEWGGEWEGFVDYPHLQYTGGLSLAELQAGKKPTIPPIVKVAAIDKEEVAMKEEIAKLKQQVAAMEKRLNNNDPVSKWAAKDWEEASENGYFDRTRPQGYITRQEAAIVTNRLRNNFKKLHEDTLASIEEIRKALSELAARVESLEK